MRTVTIVTHCWRYSRVLTYQLSSLLLHPPKNVEASIFVFYTREDQPTRDVIDFFLGQRWLGMAFGGVDIPRTHLLNRSIGRNRACREVPADVFWFTDCDYCFGEGALDALAEVDLKSSRLFYPETTWFTKDRETGDAYADRAQKPAVLEIDPADFVEHRPGKAIGGIQIVPGDVAREFGYCPDVAKHQTPVPADCFLFKRNFSDTTFRKHLNTKGTPIDVPNVFRIRQSEFGQVDSRTA
jgi:hypothetical protein